VPAARLLPVLLSSPGLGCLLRALGVHLTARLALLVPLGLRRELTGLRVTRPLLGHLLYLLSRELGLLPARLLNRRDVRLLWGLLPAQLLLWLLILLGLWLLGLWLLGLGLLGLMLLGLGLLGLMLLGLGLLGLWLLGLGLLILLGLELRGRGLFGLRVTGSLLCDLARSLAELLCLSSVPSALVCITALLAGHACPLLARLLGHRDVLLLGDLGLLILLCLGLDGLPDGPGLLGGGLLVRLLLLDSTSAGLLFEAHG